MDTRKENGLRIVTPFKIERNKLGWKVPSQSVNGNYIVSLEGDEPFCTCPDFETRHQPCKHIHAAEFAIQRQAKPGTTETVAKSTKATCTQDWLTYDNVQMHEQEYFVDLLRDLCNGIPQPEQTFGRPRLPLADVVLGAAFKV